jgi:hypothetical protein
MFNKNVIFLKKITHTHTHTHTLLRGKSKLCTYTCLLACVNTLTLNTVFCLPVALKSTRTRYKLYSALAAQTNALLTLWWLHTPAFHKIRNMIHHKTITFGLNYYPDSITASILNNTTFHSGGAGLESRVRHQLHSPSFVIVRLIRSKKM